MSPSCAYVPWSTWEPNLSTGEARGILKIWAAAFGEPCTVGFPMERSGCHQFFSVTQTLLRPYWKAATLRLTWPSRKLKPLKFVAHYYGTSVDEVSAPPGEVPRYQTGGKLDISSWRLQCK